MDPSLSSSSGHSTVRNLQSPLSGLHDHLMAPLIHDSVYRVWFEAFPSSGFGVIANGPSQGTFVTTGRVQTLLELTTDSEYDSILIPC